LIKDPTLSLFSGECLHLTIPQRIYPQIRQMNTRLLRIPMSCKRNRKDLIFSHPGFCLEQSTY